MMAKKIFFIINTLQGGGAERVVSILAKRLHELNYKVSIICLNSADSVYELPIDLPIIHLVNRKGNSSFFRGYYALQLFIKLNYILLTKRPKYIISFMTTANLWAGMSSILTKTNYIVSERTTPEETINQYNFILQKFSGFIYGKAKVIVVPSKGIEDCLRENTHFSKLNNYKVIHNPINQASNFILREVNHDRFILAVGRLSHEKGFDMLITAFKNACLPNNIQLLIVGEGPEKENLRDQIKVLNLENSVKLLGFKKDIYNYYSQAEMFVLSSRSEGYPNALIEAMSMGCACISMNCRFGPSEIIKHKYNGLLVENGNISELSKVINLLFYDANLRVKLSKNAKLINKTNSLNHITSQWEAII